MHEQHEERCKSKSSWMRLGTCSYFSIAVWLLPRSAWHLAGAQVTLGEWIHLYNSGVPYASVGLLVLCPLLDCKLVEGGSVREKWTLRVMQRVEQWIGLEPSSPDPQLTALFTPPTSLSVNTHLSLPRPFSAFRQSHALSHDSSPLLSCTWAVSSVFHLSLQLDCQHLQGRDLASSFLCSLLRATYFPSHTLSPRALRAHFSRAGWPELRSSWAFHVHTCGPVHAMCREITVVKNLHHPLFWEVCSRVREGKWPQT